jgi:hypothetical protein
LVASSGPRFIFQFPAISGVLLIICYAPYVL